MPGAVPKSFRMVILKERLLRASFEIFIPHWKHSRSVIAICSRNTEQLGPWRLQDLGRPHMACNLTWSSTSLSYREDGRTFADCGLWKGFWGEISGLTLRWMFETAVRDGSEKLRLQEKVPEPGWMNTNVATLLVGVPTRYCKVTLFGCPVRRWSCNSCVIGLKLLIRVVNEILFGRHRVCEYYEVERYESVAEYWPRTKEDVASCPGETALQQAARLVWVWVISITRWMQFFAVKSSDDKWSCLLCQRRRSLGFEEAWAVKRSNTARDIYAIPYSYIDTNLLSSDS